MEFFIKKQISDNNSVFEGRVYRCKKHIEIVCLYGSCNQM